MLVRWSSMENSWSLGGGFSGLILPSSKSSSAAVRSALDSPSSAGALNSKSGELADLSLPGGRDLGVPGLSSQWKGTLEEEEKEARATKASSLAECISA